MRVGELESAVTRDVRPPRAMAWVVLLAATAAVVLIGLLGTAFIISPLHAWPVAPAWSWAPPFVAACALTVTSLSLRSLRWIFLLRRAETRIPIRDAYIGYFAGLSLLFTPFLLGEIAVRAAINRSRGAVPIATTMVVNVWERLLDAAALGVIAVAAGLVSGRVTTWNYLVGGGAVLLLITPLRRVLLRLLATAAAIVARPFERQRREVADYARLSTMRVWLVGLAASAAAWVLPGLSLWLLARIFTRGVSLSTAEHAYAASATLSGLTLTPGGVLVAGRQMLSALAAHGVADAPAVVVVVAVRLATVGVSVVLGGLFLLLHRRSAAARSETHFDDIADAYDVQIPESRRHALLERKTRLMQELLGERLRASRGLDVGCGQGAYVGRMRALGFDVHGIDASAGQVLLAGRNIGDAGVITTGSALAIPADDGAYDFLYVINVLHHLSSIEEQRRAFAEMLRVLRPGGLLFVHEINTRNILFRFYMGYVFPSLNCIDEGVERWLLPHTLHQYTDAPVVDVRYFTFLPDFVPQVVARLLSPLERMLEQSRFGVFSAHYMAVIRKDPAGA